MTAGVIDLHVHAGPDVRPRKMTAVDLVRAAQAAGMRGLLLKNHDTPTTLLAAALAESFPGFAVRGGLVLNESVGGFNLAAVETALRMDAAEIWMPTHCAAREHAFRKQTGGMTVLDCAGRLRSEVTEILRLIAGSTAMLGTGHLSPQEIMVLVPAARRAGVRKVVVTHPEIAFVDLPLAAQRDLSEPGVWFERCFVREGFAVDWDGLARNIREIGPRSTVLATDLGQPGNPAPPDGLRRMYEELRARDISAADLDLMLSRNPAELLDLSI